jgi:hypothetical protein
MIAALEWRIARRERRLFVLNTAVPLALTGAVALGAAPRVHAALVYTFVIVFFGTFGSAIPLVRDAESGLFGRIARTGIAPSRILAERTAFHAGLDLLQLLPSLVLAFLVARTPAGTALQAIFAAACVLLTTNALGVWTAAFGRSIAEAALFATVLALFALHFGGVFRTPPAGTTLAFIADTLPFGHLQRALRAAFGMPGEAVRLLPAVTGAFALFGTTVLAAAPLVRSLAKRAGK